MKKQRIFKLFVNYEKEEAWLNKLAAQGLHCVDYMMGRYTFEKGAPGEYTYRIQLLENVPTQAESRAYLEFLEESGVEHIASHLRWVYLRKKTVDGPFELFSDISSRIAHYRRVVTMFIPIFLANFMFGLRAFHGGYSFSLLNLGAALLLAIPLLAYSRQLFTLSKERKIRE